MRIWLPSSLCFWLGALYPCVPTWAGAAQTGKRDCSKVSCMATDTQGKEALQDSVSTENQSSNCSAPVVFQMEKQFHKYMQVSRLFSTEVSLETLQLQNCEIINFLVKNVPSLSI